VTEAVRRLGRLVRRPALHFVLLGGLLFAADSWWQDGAGPEAAIPPAETIVISAGQVEQMRRDLRAQNGMAPTAAQLDAAIEGAIDEEVLYREALAIGLDRDNAAVRQRLVQDARFVADDPDQDEDALYRMALELGLDRSDQVVRRQLSTTMWLVASTVLLKREAPPDEAELEAYLRQHPEQFMEPWRVRLSHVYLSKQRRGAAAGDDARSLLETLRAGHIGPDKAPALGDPFLHGSHLAWLTRQGLQQRFGADFAAAVTALVPGAWSEPIRSTYGWHLVWVEGVQPAALPSLDAVRNQVLGAVLEERRAQRMRTTLDALRQHYTIRVEDTPPQRATLAGPSGHG
jgi:hypothetical protein